MSKIYFLINTLINKKKYKEAIKLAFLSSLKYPENKDLSIILEKVLNYSSLKEIILIYKKIFETKKAHSSHYYNLAMFYKRNKKYIQMENTFKDLIKNKRNEYSIYLYIAFIYLYEYEEAFKVAKILSKEKNPEPFYSRLWNFWGDRDNNLPKNYIEKHIKKIKKFKKFINYKNFLNGAFLFYSNKQNLAFKEFKKIKKDLRTENWIYFLKGWNALYLRKYNIAEKSFKKSSLSLISKAQSMARLGEIYICKNKIKKGLSFFDKAIKNAHFSHLPGLLTWKGQMLLFIGNYKEAKKFLIKGKDLNDQASLCWLGALYLKEKQKENALKTLKESIKLFPTDLETKIWYGETLRELKKYKEAKREFDLIIKENPNSSFALLNRAILNYHLNNFFNMKNDFFKIDKEIIFFLKENFPIKNNENEILYLKRIILKTFDLAKGNRRDDKYFYPLWLKL